MGSWLLVWLCSLTLGFAQQPASTYTQADSIRAGLIRAADKADSLATPYATHIADSTLTQRDSVFYTKLKTRMYKHRLTRQLYDALFQDVYNSRISTGEVSRLEVNPFIPFKGRTINAIYIRRLSVFGQSVYDTLRKSSNWVERVGNSVHTNTREGIIRRSYLLFREGDAVNPVLLRDNERLLRATAIFHDARIMVVPIGQDKKQVDIYVITQDVWSLLPTVGIGSLTQFSVGLEERNVRGLGHRLYVYGAYSGLDPRQKFEYQTRYTVPNIGRTFLTAQAEFIYLRDQKQGAIRVFRPFLTPETKYAGSVELTHAQINNRVVTRDDSVRLIPVRYNFSDVWIGRSFRLFYREGENNERGRARLIVGLRNTNYLYVNRPTVTADTNQLYQDSRTTLLSVGFSRRKYTRDVLIYGFGRTEDVPIGKTGSIVAGIDNAELGRRYYTGLNYSQGGYLRQIGYVYGLASVGGFWRKNAIQQGVFSAEMNYFSPLLGVRWGNMRHFLNVRYTSGINRFTNEYISLSGSSNGLMTDGIGIRSDALRGTKRLLLNYETILFSRVNFIGFRIAFIGFVNLGMTSFPEISLLKSPLYQGYGLAFRLRNENLTFNSFQIRLAYYPNIPNNRTPFRQGFEGVPALRFRDFDLTAPQIIPYR